MRNKSINSLHDLIKSLNKAEKSYFKKNRTGVRNNDNVYVKLFDVIDKMDEYDEKKVIVKMKGHNIKQLPSVKKYLYNLIMNSLVAFYKEDNIDKIIDRDIEKANILFAKLLFKDAHKLLVKAKELAYKYERYVSANKIVHLQSDYLIYISERSNLDESLKELYDEQQQLNELINNEAKYKYYFDSLTLTFQSRDKRMTKKELFSTIDKMLKAPALASHELALTTMGKVFYYRMLYTYFSIKGELGKGYTVINKALALFKENPHLMEVHIKELLSVYNGVLATTRGLVKEDEMLAAIKDLKVIHETVGRPNDERLVIYSKMAVYQNLIIYYLVSVEHDKVKEMMPEVVEFLERDMHKVRFDKLVSLMFNIAEFYFNDEQYDESLYWWSKLSIVLSKNQLSNILDVCKVYMLICHYELKTITLDSVIRTTLAYFEKQKEPHLAEKAIIKSVKRRSKMGFDKEKILEDFKGLKKELAEIKVFGDENHILLDLYSNRLEHITQGITMVELHKRMFEANKSKLAKGIHYY